MDFVMCREFNGFLNLSFSHAYISCQAMPGACAALSICLPSLKAVYEDTGHLYRISQWRCPSLKPLLTLHKDGGVYCFMLSKKTATRRPPQGGCTGSVGLPWCRIIRRVERPQRVLKQARWRQKQYRASSRPAMPVSANCGHPGRKSPSEQ